MMSKGISVCVALLAFCMVCTAQDYEITHFRCDNDVTSVAYKDGTLFVGTRTGLIVLRDGVLSKFTSADGLPNDGVLNVAPIDSETLYIGPFGQFDGEQWLLEARLDGASISVRSVTPVDPPLRRLMNMMAVAPDGTLWVVDERGLRHFDGDNWAVYDARLSMPDGAICFDALGRLWTSMSATFKVMRLDSGRWQSVSTPFRTSAVGTDNEGEVWCASGEGLHYLSGDDWLLMSDDPVWNHEMLWTKRIVFDDAGNLWAFAAGAIVRFDGTTLTHFTEADGLVFQAYNLRGFPLISSCAVMPSETLIFGLRGHGVIFAQGDSFTNVRFTDCLPGGYVNDIVEDSLGRIWTRGIETSMLGIHEDSAWQQIDASSWLPNEELILKYYSSGQMALDLEGAVWVRASDGARRFDRDEMTVFNEANSELITGGYVCAEAGGTVWFSTPSEFGGPSDAVAVGFHEETWQRYSSTGYFNGERPSDMTIGPDNEVWFRRDTGYTVFNGTAWRQVSFGGDEIHHPGRMFFDARGTAYLATTSFSGEPKSLFVKRQMQVWHKELEVLVKDVQVDSDGTVWLATDEGIYLNRGDGWSIPDFNRHFTDPEQNIWYAEKGALRITIDHDGAKWIGTPSGLSLVQDGGPAQQSVKIEIVGPQGGELTVSLLLQNAGRPIAVDVWAAVGLGGQLFYLPNFSPEPHSTPLILPALSTERLELLGLDYDDLPAGRYDLYAALSLTGDSSKMIGPADDKIAFNSVQKD